MFSYQNSMTLENFPGEWTNGCTVIALILFQKTKKLKKFTWILKNRQNHLKWKKKIDQINCNWTIILFTNLLITFRHHYRKNRKKIIHIKKVKTILQKNNAKNLFKNCKKKKIIIPFSYQTNLIFWNKFEFFQFFFTFLKIFTNKRIVTNFGWLCIKIPWAIEPTVIALIFFFFKSGILKNVKIEKIHIGSENR